MLSGDRIRTGRRPFNNGIRLEIRSALSFTLFQSGGFLAQRILFFSAVSAAVATAAVTVACLSVHCRLYIEKFNLLPCTRRRQIWFHTARSSKVNLHRPDILGCTILYIRHSRRVRRKAEHAELLNIHRMTVIQRRPHRFHEVRQHTLDIPVRKGTFLFHLVRDTLQRHCLTHRNEAGMKHYLGIFILRVFPITHFLKWYCHSKLRIEN